MHPTIRSILAAPPVHRLLYHLVHLYSRTFRLQVDNEARWLQLIDAGTPVLLCTWHQQFFSAIRHFRKYAKYRPALMISRSRDGAIIVPFSVAADRALVFNSWDRFMLPLPFSRVTLRFAEPVRFTPTTDPQTFEEQRARLEALILPCLITG